MRRAKLQHFSFVIPPLQPGESHRAEFIAPSNFRPQRIVVSPKAGAPEIHFYQRKAGSSKRKGRLASIRFFAALLRHPHTHADLFITDIRVNRITQLAGEGGIPSCFFSPEAFAGDLNMDVCPAGRKVEIDFLNHEFARIIFAGVACFGVVPE